MSTIPIPLDTDQFWPAARSLGFALPHCLDCLQFHFYPQPACPFCGSQSIELVQTPGEGEVYSYTVVYRAPAESFRAAVPYIIAIVRTDAGPHMMTRLCEISPEGVHVGLRVKVRWKDDQVLPFFEPKQEL